MTKIGRHPTRQKRRRLDDVQTAPGFPSQTRSGSTYLVGKPGSRRTKTHGTGSLSLGVREAVFDAVSDALYIVQPDMSIALVNKTFRDWCREAMVKENVVGMKLTDALPFLPEKAMDEYRQVFESGLVYVSEQTFKLGTVERATQTRKIPLFNDGRVAHVLTIVREIGEQREADKVLLQRSQQNFRSLIENSTDIIVTLDANHRITYASPYIERLLGHQPQRIIGESAFRFVHRDDLPAVVHTLTTALQRLGFSQSLEHRFCHTDGSWRYFQSSGKSVLDDFGNPMIMITMRDITERKQAEEALKSSEEKYRTLVESSSDAILMIDRERRIASFNQAFLQLFGYTREEVEGKSARIMHPTLENFRVYAERAYPILETENTFRVEWAFMRKGGVIFPVETVTSAIRESDGSISGYVAIIRDITERKRAEDQIRYLSFHDKLTDLYNRAYFEEELKQLDTSRELPLSLITGDVNGLKLVNDAFGHSEGDKLLGTIARVLQTSCRKGDIVARWGGDEFVILLPRTEETIAMEIAKRMRKALSETEGNPVQPSMALGVASKRDANHEIHEVLKEAEDRMYRNKLMESESARSSIIYSLRKTLWERSHETEEHAVRIQKLAVEVGRAVSLPDNELDELALLGTLHDIGKIAIPDEILVKPGPLSPEEWEVMKKHPEIGYRIAESSHELAHIAQTILAHHEWWDGSGYPKGLKGEEIPLISRILAIVDAYDVMTHERPYKGILSHEEALNEIRKNQRIQFDPNLVETFVRIMTGREEREAMKKRQFEKVTPLLRPAKQPAR